MAAGSFVFFPHGGLAVEVRTTVTKTVSSFTGQAGFGGQTTSAGSSSSIDESLEPRAEDATAASFAVRERGTGFSWGMAVT